MSRLLTILPLLVFCLLVTSAASVLGDTDFTPDYHPVLHVSATDGAIDIDGDLNDPGWRNAARATNFCETSPGDQIKPTVRTEALVTYDQSHLYIAIIAWDDPSHVRVSMCDRDNIFRDDYVGILVDTYADMAWGYEIFANPLGIQGDLRITSDGNEDISLNLVFESVGQVTDSGYQVEFAIPFASLRFPDKDEQTWRFNFWRDRQRDKRYRYSWAAQDWDNSCWMCQWGTLTGIEGVKPGSNLDLLPNILTRQVGGYSYGAHPDTKYDNLDAEAELSLFARYGLSTNSSLELAINPDFSQVESDAGQIDVNTTFALYYAEQRPFFQEGSDLFGTWIDAIYTRSINSPDIATKFTLQSGPFSVAYLLARDDKAPLLVPMREQSLLYGLDKAWDNVLRMRYTFGQSSYIGAMLTDRRSDAFTRDSVRFDEGSGTLYGIDGRVRFTKSLQLEYQVLGSYTEEPTPDRDYDIEDTVYFDDGRRTAHLDGEMFAGNAIYVSLEQETHHFGIDFDYWEYSPDFRSDLGFTTRTDYREFSLSTSLFWRPNTWLVEWGPSLDIGRWFKHNGTINLNPSEYNDGQFDEYISPNLYFQFKGQTTVQMNYLQSRERYKGTIFPGISRGWFYIYSRPLAWLSGGFEVTHGRTIYRSLPTMGIVTKYSVWSRIKLTQKCVLLPSLDYARMDHRDAYLESHPGTEKELYSGYIFRNQLNYQFSRELYLRLIVEYNDFSDRLAIEPLITYQINPFTVFYAGANTGYQHYQDDLDYWDPSSDTDRSVDHSLWKLNSHQVFAKFQYLFRI